MQNNKIQYFLISLLFVARVISSAAQGTDLWNQGISIIPYPQKVEMTGEEFRFKKQVNIFIYKEASAEELDELTTAVRLAETEIEVAGETVN